MPGIVKAFIEALEPLRGREGNPPIGFLVQSGFPESAHSRHLERYLEKLAARLGSPYIGTIVKGGCEGVRLMPDKMNRNSSTHLIEAGHTIARKGPLRDQNAEAIAKPERYPRYLVPLFKVLQKHRCFNFYWNGLLKENGVYDQRFAQPYIKE